MEEYRKAARAWLQALAINPQLAEALYNLGALLHRAGQPDMARCLWKETVDLDPDFRMAWYNLGAISADPQEARRMWDKERRNGSGIRFVPHCILAQA